ncbi:hypothetical protein F0562_030846 [Nyssa sinensis]|uniref:Uncharacterized protein n=1 Tax=Nyssa sinensis TaxID=561372 RepID=A0A5J5AZI3_9ASTE|nr:hypothetical protein F0562_030846 [Nyssa sinensis]
MSEQFKLSPHHQWYRNDIEAGSGDLYYDGGASYTFNLKKEEENKEAIRKIRAQVQAIRAAFLFQAAGENVNGTPKLPPSPVNDYDIEQEALATMTRNHDFSVLQQYGGASLFCTT